MLDQSDKMTFTRWSWTTCTSLTNWTLAAFLATATRPPTSTRCQHIAQARAGTGTATPTMLAESGAPNTTLWSLTSTSWVAHCIHALGMAAGGKAVTLVDAALPASIRPADKSAQGALLTPKRLSQCPTSNLQTKPTSGCLKTEMRPALTFATATRTTWIPCLSTGKMAWSLHSPFGGAATTMICGGWMTAQAARVREAA